MKTNYASPLARFVAIFIDAALINLPIALLFYQLGVSENIPLVVNTSLYLWVYVGLSWLIWGFYESVMNTLYGGSLGKLIVGTRVVDSSNKHLSLKRNLFRSFVAGMVSSSVLYLGYLWIIVDKKTRRGWHDLISGSYVVSIKNNLLIGLATLVVLSSVLAYLFFQGLLGFKANESMYTDLISDIAAELDKLGPTPTPTPTPVVENRTNLKSAKVSFNLPSGWKSSETESANSRSAMQVLTTITHSEKVPGSESEQVYTLNVYKILGTKQFTQSDISTLQTQVENSLTASQELTLESSSGLKPYTFSFGQGYYLDIHTKSKDGYTYTSSYVIYPKENSLYLLEALFPFDSYVKYELDNKGIDRKDQIRKIVDSFIFE